MQFCFGRFDSETSTCQGNLLGTVNSAEDCCLPIPRGLGGGGYVAAGAEDCVSCMRFTGKCTRACVIITCNIMCASPIRMFAARAGVLLRDD